MKKIYLQKCRVCGIRTTVEAYKPWLGAPHQVDMKCGCRSVYVNAHSHSRALACAVKLWNKGHFGFYFLGV